jgi:hypothetical protein
LAEKRKSDHKARVIKPNKQVGRPDGRRRFGSVSGAILAVLASTETEMKVKATKGVLSDPPPLLEGLLVVPMFMRVSSACNSPS